MSRTVFLFLVLTLGNAAFGNAAPRIENLHVISIPDGVTTVPHFASDGADARIVKAWRGNDDAHGYWVYLTMLPSRQEYRSSIPGGSWDLATVETDKGPSQELVYERPFDGEQYQRSVRFARGRVDGKDAGLLIVAARDLSHTQSYIDAVPVALDIYRLVAQEELPGQTPYAFQKIVHRRSKTKYRDSELALHEMLGLPLPKEADVDSNTIDGGTH